MKAFVEILSGIVRVGPRSEKYGDPWELAVAFSSIDGRTVVLKALQSDKELKLSHLKATIKVLRELGLEPTWVRIKDETTNNQDT